MTPAAKRFLIIRPSSLGDVVHALPALRTLRANHPKAHIAWLIEERYRDLLHGNPDLNAVIEVRTKVWRKRLNLETLSEIRDTIRYIKEQRFDTVFDLTGLFKSGLIAWLSGAPKRIGFHKRDLKESASAWFTNQKADTVTPEHVVDRYRELILLAGGDKTLDTFPFFSVPPECRRQVAAFFDEDPEFSRRPVAAVNPGAGFPSKLWKPERFAAVADRLVQELGFSVLITWGPGEKELAESIAGRMNAPHKLAPKTSILESIALYRRLALMISCDSGPLHLCAALGVPTVALFGPTDPLRNGPYGAGHTTIMNDLPCSHCWKKTCPLKTDECMETISVDAVFQAAERIAAQCGKAIPSS